MVKHSLSLKFQGVERVQTWKLVKCEEQAAVDGASESQDSDLDRS